MVPVGLIVNELITNSFKHAFGEEPADGEDERTNSVEINLEALDEGQYHLSIGDNGIGLPKEVSIDSPSNLGLQLVNMLVQQLNGTVDVHGDPGTKYMITFRARNASTMRGNDE